MKTLIIATIIAGLIHLSWVNSPTFRATVARMATLNMVLGR